MAKRVWWVGLAAIGIFVLSGCTTISRNDELLNQVLRNKISALETQLKEKDDEISSLKETSVKSSEGFDAGVSKTGEANLQVDPKQIQTALKNAGYYQGTVDGKLGKKTRRAVRDFQKANNLHADGRVGEKTWAILKDYLQKKVK